MSQDKENVDPYEIFQPGYINQAIHAIKKDLNRKRSVRVKLLSQLKFLYNRVSCMVEEDESLQYRIVKHLKEWEDLIIETTRLSLSLSHPVREVNQVYADLYDIGSYIETIIIAVYAWCKNNGKVFGNFTMHLVNTLLEMSADNPNEWLYSVTISPLVHHTMNAFLFDDHKDVREQWTKALVHMIKKLAKAVFCCGDFWCQYYLMAVITAWVQWSPASRVIPMINETFSLVTPEARKAFVQNVDSMRIRYLLNAINTNDKGPKTTIPIPCLYLFVGNKELKPPECVTNPEEDFWIDFSIPSGRMHVFYSVPEELPFLSLSVWRYQIDSVCINWVVNEGKSQSSEEDTQSSVRTFQKDERVLFLHLALNCDFESITTDIPSIFGKGYRSIYIALQTSGEAVQRIVEQMSYNIHTCGTKNCMRPKLLRELLSSQKKLSYSQSWCPDSQVVGLDQTPSVRSGTSGRTLQGNSSSGTPTTMPSLSAVSTPRKSVLVTPCSTPGKSFSEGLFTPESLFSRIGRKRLRTLEPQTPLSSTSESSYYTKSSVTSEPQTPLSNTTESTYYTNSPVTPDPHALSQRKVITPEPETQVSNTTGKKHLEYPRTPEPRFSKLSRKRVRTPAPQTPVRTTPGKRYVEGVFTPEPSKDFNDENLKTPEPQTPRTTTPGKRYVEGLVPPKSHQGRDDENLRTPEPQTPKNTTPGKIFVEDLDSPELNDENMKTPEPSNTPDIRYLEERVTPKPNAGCNHANMRTPGADFCQDLDRVLSPEFGLHDVDDTRSSPLSSLSPVDNTTPTNKRNLPQSSPSPPQEKNVRHKRNLQKSSPTPPSEKTAKLKRNLPKPSPSSPSQKTASYIRNLSQEYPDMFDDDTLSPVVGYYKRLTQENLEKSPSASPTASAQAVVELSAQPPPESANSSEEFENTFDDDALSPVVGYSNVLMKQKAAKSPSLSPVLSHSAKKLEKQIISPDASKKGSEKSFAPPPPESPNSSEEFKNTSENDEPSPLVGYSNTILRKQKTAKSPSVSPVFSHPAKKLGKEKISPNASKNERDKAYPISSSPLKSRRDQLKKLIRERKTPKLPIRRISRKKLLPSVSPPPPSAITQQRSSSISPPLSKNPQKRKPLQLFLDSSSDSDVNVGGNQESLNVQRKTPCYANAHEKELRKTLNRSHDPEFDVYDPWQSSQMQEYRKKLFPRTRTYPGVKKSKVEHKISARKIQVANKQLEEERRLFLKFEEEQREIAKRKRESQESSGKENDGAKKYKSFLSRFSRRS